ncbi:MAG: TolC family protein [Candidatus Hydrogenedentes bacterium]|nr:TolC family protein [Candidatus Hydrogenedentota bacterium]
MNSIANGLGATSILACLLFSISLSAEETPASSTTLPPSIQVEPDEVMMSEGVAEPIDLNTALALALEGNIDFALAQANEAAAKIRVSGGKSAFLPGLEADAGFSIAEGTVQGSFGDFRDIDAQGHRVGVALTYGVNIGEQVKELAALRKELDAAVFNTLAAEQRLIFRVVELYENLVLSKVGVNIASQLVSDAESFEHIARVRAEAGVGLGADVARAEANAAASKSRLEEAREVWRQTSIRLATVLRRDPSVLLDPRESASQEWRIATGDENENPAAMTERRPDVAAARQEARAASDRVLAARWDLFGPRLVAEARLSGVGGRGEPSRRDTPEVLSDAVGGFDRAARNWGSVLAGAAPLSSAAGSFTETFYDYRDLFRDRHQDVGLAGRTDLSIGLMWSISFAKRDRLREVKIAEERAQLRAEQLEEIALGEVRSAQSAIESSSARIGFAENELEAAETNHRIALTRYREGVAIALEVLDAQQAIAQARLNLARYVIDFNLAQARLLASAGLIDDSDFVHQPAS